MTLQLLAFSWGGLWDVTGLTLAHAAGWVLILLGVIGTVMPVLPGPPLVFVGALVHRLLVGAEGSVTILTLVVLGLLAIGSLVVEYGAGAVGAKKYGATQWGVWGSLIGLVGGLIVFGLIGMVVGTLLGAFISEYLFARKKAKEAGVSSWGAVLGTVLGTLSKVAFTAVMMIWLVVDLWWV